MTPPDLRDARVGVTGAAGFVGANLCRKLLAAGAEVHALVRPRSDRHRLTDLESRLRVAAVDLCDRVALQATLQAVRPEIVFHAAIHNAYRTDDPLHPVVADNVVATANLIDVLAELGNTRLVHLSSSTEYGPTDQPHHEDDPLQPITRHGATKAAATLIVVQQAQQGVLPAVVLRLFSVYGPWESEHRLVPLAIRAALTGAVLPLTQPGLRRDYVFVDDAAEACLRAAVADTTHGEIYNVGSGKQTANEELVAEVGRVVGREVRTVVGGYAAHATDTMCWVADVDRAREHLGWSVRHSLAEGLAQTVEWIRGRS